jgi:hypothetical protein
MDPWLHSVMRGKKYGEDGVFTDLLVCDKGMQQEDCQVHSFTQRSLADDWSGAADFKDAKSVCVSGLLREYLVENQCFSV